MSTKVLIVDDEPATVEMLATFMEISGYEPAKATSGNDGLTLLELERPDVLLLDLMMPDIEGFEFCQRMRAQEAFAKTPVLIISARADDEAIKQAYAAGANAYITKPLNLMQLLGEMERLISSV